MSRLFISQAIHSVHYTELGKVIERKALVKEAKELSTTVRMQAEEVPGEGPGKEVLARTGPGKCLVEDDLRTDASTNEHVGSKGQNRKIAAKEGCGKECSVQNYPSEIPIGRFPIDSCRND